jgi:chromosome segregation ATPase
MIVGMLAWGAVMGDKHSDLVKATMALDEELAGVERLAESAGRITLGSRRNLEKAARTINEAAQAQTHVGERIRTLMEALDVVRAKNEATLQAMQARSEEIKRRGEELALLLERFEAIGREAREISQLAGDKDKLPEMETRMAAIAESARTLWQDADGGGWSDLARDAEGLRQQVLAAKNKLGLIAKRQKH